MTLTVRARVGGWVGLVRVRRRHHVHSNAFCDWVGAVGIENLEERIETTSFPWILTNAFDKVSGLPLASCHEALVIDWHGVKIGLMGLVESEWLETLPTIDPSDVDYHGFVEVARDKAREMRGNGVDLVIALTHMRVRNDTRLATEVGWRCANTGTAVHARACSTGALTLLCASSPCLTPGA